MNKYLDKIYQEGENDTFVSGGVTYPINKYLKIGATKPTVQIPVSELKWVLQYDKADPARVEKADITAPLLVTKWQGKLVAVDGLHRLTKAVQQGVKTLPCKIIEL